MAITLFFLLQQLKTHKYLFTITQDKEQQLEVENL